MSAVTCICTWHIGSLESKWSFKKDFLKAVILEQDLERWENVSSRGKSINTHSYMCYFTMQESLQRREIPKIVQQEMEE